MIANPELQVCQAILHHITSKDVPLLEANLCRPGHSLIHLPFHKADTVVNFQWKQFLTRSNSKGSKQL